MTKWISALVLGLAFASFGGVSSSSASTPHDSALPLDAEEDCLEPVPVSYSFNGLTDDGEPLSLDILVLLDDVSKERGKEVMAKASEPYEPLDISLDYRFETVAFVPETGAGTDEAASLADRVIEQAEQWTMGNRPADVDIVYTITNQNITDAAGKADCIGGVRSPDGAYAVGENYKRENYLGLLYKNGTAKIAAHEIGHLMGAHHHYSNCAEGMPGAVDETGPTPCTTMFGFIEPISMGFGSLEAAVMRGHTIDYASQGPDVNDVYSSTVTLNLTNGKATGAVTSDRAGCRKRVPVEIQSYSTKDGWNSVAQTKTKKNGNYKTRIAGAPAPLRVFVPQFELTGGGPAGTCAQAASAAR